MKQRLITIALCIMLTACSGIQPAATPAPTAVTGSQAPSEPPATVTLTLPNWPMVAYSRQPEEAFLLLVVKDPKSFPLPKEITFTKADGTTIVIPMLQPDKKVPK